MTWRLLQRYSRRMLLAGIVLLISARTSEAQEFFDAVDDHLKFSAFNQGVVGKISGLIDLEEYYVQQPPPGVIYDDHSLLFNPRLTLNLDVQIGPQLYLFAQGRFDRGFDPNSEGAAQVRADQYALRYTPWEDGRFNIQVGKSATVVGSWALRDDSWQNPFVTAPLPYENLTGVWDAVAAPSGSTLTSWAGADKSLRIPIIWEGAYSTGASVFGSLGKFDYAADFKNAALSARPESWSATSVGFSNPSFSGRLGYRPNEAWNLGVSSSVGTYLMPSASDTLAPGQSLSDYKEILIAQDASFAWHHLQIWAECFETRFEVPTVGNADTLAYYIEAKYKFSPSFFAALRWNQQLFNTVPNGTGGDAAWGSDIDRIDAAVTYRFSPHLQAKLQYSYLDQGSPIRTDQSFAAAQVTLQF